MDARRYTATRDRYEADVDCAHGRLGDELAYQISSAAVLEWLHQVIDESADAADFPPDMGPEDVRSPWVHAAAERLARIARDIAATERRETNYQIASAPAASGWWDWFGFGTAVDYTRSVWPSEDDTPLLASVTGGLVPAEWVTNFVHPQAEC